MSILFTKPLHKNVENISAPNLLKEALYSGYLEKRSGGTLRDPYQKRFFVIARNMLWWFKTEQSAAPQGQVILQEYTVIVPDTDSKTTEFEEEEFLIKPRKDSSLARTFFFKCDTVKQKQDWVDMLRQETDTPIKAPTQTRLRAEELKLDSIDMKITQKGNGFMQGIFRNKEQAYLQLLAKLDETTNEELSQFYHDIEPTANLSHKHIIPIFGFYKDKMSLYLVTKFPRAGKLSEILYQPTIKLTLANKVDLCVWISLGMIYLHSKNMVHGNLNPSAVMVDDQKEGKVYVSEYGLTFFRKKWVQNSFTAPEVKSWKDNTKESDVYSFGVLMWEIYTREQVLLNHAEMTIGQYVTRKVTELPDLAALVQKCCAENPAERPTFFQVYQTLLNIARDVTPTPVRASAFSTVRKTDADTKRDVAADDPDSALNSDQALMRFGARPEKHWKDFVWIMANCLDKDPMVVVEQMEALRPFLAPDNILKKDSWKNFVRYFPVRYSKDEPNTFTLVEIGKIVSQPWFFGEASHSKSKELLKDKPAGSFLLRFSKEPGSYQLSLSSGESTAHVRIAFQENRYMIETREYDSLESLMNIHKENPISTLYGEIKLTEPVDKSPLFSSVIPFDFTLIANMVNAKQQQQQQQQASQSPTSTPQASPQEQPLNAGVPASSENGTSNHNTSTTTHVENLPSSTTNSTTLENISVTRKTTLVLLTPKKNGKTEDQPKTTSRAQQQFGFQRTASARNMKEGVLLSKQRSESPPITSFHEPVPIGKRTST
eukprot:CAMPEP_0168563464 /NCGR_PEP_ID=MMETSP0413-20121227/12691_1 /TAXON_ID=136452 /ORGANISM="Filamoeba nolandi, Strain NC-AS-23-1" /LENGTH=770 /DNA_ID=CAMNT_0008595001 /DNA_START=99 /DNA_END=2411 /DNA_ORIENTATION=-